MVDYGKNRWLVMDSYGNNRWLTMVNYGNNPIH